MLTRDFLVIGGGIIGLCVARELKKKYPNSKIALIEKEKDCGMHASTRNSGVLHAGFYYTSDSLKAKFTSLGNKLMTEYCEGKTIPVNKCGKLVVAKNEDDISIINELLERGKRNGIELKELSEEGAKKIEPRVRTFKKAIFSPNTSTVDPELVVNAIKHDAEKENIEINCNSSYIEKKGNAVVTSQGQYSAAYVINAAGLYADLIAKDFGFSENYRILPFKGLYLYSNEPIGALKSNIYPVPDLRNPFLGVHFTVTANKKIKIGPTAVPALWREQYNLVDNFKFSELIDVVIRELSLFMNSDFDFKKIALEEVKKYSRRYLLNLASKLVDNVKEECYTEWGQPGIRAQLVDIKKRKLEMDFIVEGDENSIHILNAVSPGFTCSIPFARYVCDKIDLFINRRSI